MGDSYPIRVTTWIKAHWHAVALALLLGVGLYLRFWNFDHSIDVGWDQARDAWKVRDILTGTLVLDGPRTGVGHVYLGPLWYYYLAPFYALTRLDPSGAFFANILVNIFNFTALYWVTRRIWNSHLAIVAVYILTINGYLIDVTKTPWNVSPVVGVSILIFYCIYAVVIEQRYRHILILATLTGIFVHLHFAFVFLPPIILLSLFMARDKRQVLKYSLLGLPLFCVWIVPLVFLDIQWKGDNTGWLRNFMRDYIIDGFHFRFFLIRIHDAFVQFERVLAIPHSISWGKFVPLALFVLVTLRTRGKRLARNVLMVLWFLIPAVVYTFYSGSTSEYYVLLNAPIVIYVVLAMIEWLCGQRSVPKNITYVVIVLSLVGYGLISSRGHWIKRSTGGLTELKIKTRECIEAGCVKEFNIGFMDSYLYSTWTDPKYQNYPF